MRPTGDRPPRAWWGGGRYPPSTITQTHLTERNRDRFPSIQAQRQIQFPSIPHLDLERQLHGRSRVDAILPHRKDTTCFDIDDLGLHLPCSKTEVANLHFDHDDLPHSREAFVDIETHEFRLELGIEDDASDFVASDPWTNEFATATVRSLEPDEQRCLILDGGVKPAEIQGSDPSLGVNR